MRNFLEEIIARRREEVVADRAGNDAEALRERALELRAGRVRLRLRETLRSGDGVRIICEFKRASPSLGFIRRDARVAEMIAHYERGGAAAISVLTEPEYFHGSLDDLRAAREATVLPILRKDFIVDEVQIDEAAEAGADAILLIVAALTDDELSRLRQHAEDNLGLDALVEVHSAEELARGVRAGAGLIGVNNRDLRTLQTSLETSVNLAARAPHDVTLVSESGISSLEEIERLRACGYHGFLIGESLMRSSDPVAQLRSLRAEVRYA
ncbi:MAG: indole-3-glycerol phosphate synthase TrpC [Chthoniobacterales bacterium]